jgi:hypothetical protein
MFSFDDCKSKCKDYLQKIIDLNRGTELLSTLQASCQLCMDTFESRCQTAEALQNFKRELGRAKAAYAGTTSDYYAYVMHYGNGWCDPIFEPIILYVYGNAECEPANF